MLQRKDEGLWVSAGRIFFAFKERIIEQISQKAEFSIVLKNISTCFNVSVFYHTNHNAAFDNLRSDTWKEN